MMQMINIKNNFKFHQTGGSITMQDSLLVDVGMTPCFAVPELAEQFGCANVWIKDEAQNPFGTYKDRRSSSITKKAVQSGVDALMLITAGNAGYSLRQFCTPVGITVYHIVDEQVSPIIQEYLSGPNSHVIRCDLNHVALSSDDLIRIAQDDHHKIVWDVSNGFHCAYHSLLDELCHLDPDIIIVPFGSGETFHGLLDVIQERNLSIRLIGVGVQNLTQSMAEKLCAIWTPYLSLNEGVEEQGHKLIRLSEPDIADAFKIAQRFMTCEPSSAVVFSALQQMTWCGDERIVLVNSGQGISSKSKPKT